MRLRHWTTAERNLFRRYHYLSAEHTKSISTNDIRILDLWKEPIWYCSVIHFPHPINKKIKKIHRLVIRPDYQWLWIWIKFLERVCDRYYKRWYDIAITTSQFALVYWLKKRPNRICTHFWKWWLQSRKTELWKKMNKTASVNRIIYTFKYKPLQTNN